ncbi:hypothetical protein CXZ10_00425 [Pleomorphomonas diazotrophica]|uniref:SGNH hydrolase-type esterase domain-containing protein n=1 Tax=Pleomorphomonas diazotrophica TaxID=1166257 RepID=A0A1I4U8E8_9HYPH|nr:GDSL-type esterase/lipase family protein [Pleomorphomonas diazotrophica]PKR91218.1 hypothetical protein CXZ10_00425 [Pleomorphomonas diazotrophica]SFM84983.1 Lysophospholipase L1 [Pleomorphomonas diazotrophica]
MIHAGRGTIWRWLVLPVVLCLLALTEARADDSACDPLAIDLTLTPARTQLYSGLRETVKVQAARPDRADVVLIGDSLFAGWRTDLPTTFPSTTVYDFSAGGDRIPNALWRLENTDLSSLLPSAAALLIGTNDLAAGTPACAIATGIETVAKKLRALWPETPVLVLTIPPRGADFHSLDDRRLEVNKAIAGFAGRLGNVYAVAIDDDAFTCGQYGKPRPAGNAAAPRLSCDNYADDNLHFTQKGYVELGRMLQGAARKALGKAILR